MRGKRRSFRRWQYAKRRAKWRKRIEKEVERGWRFPMTDRDIAREAGWRTTSPAFCSCSNCGNIRRCGWVDPRTRQEVRSDESFREQMDEYFCD